MVYNFQTEGSFVIPENARYFAYAKDEAGNVSDPYEFTTTDRKVIEVTLPSGDIEYHLNISSAVANLTFRAINSGDIKLLEDDSFGSQIVITTSQNFRLNLNGAVLNAYGTAVISIDGKLQIVNGQISGDSSNPIIRNNATGTLTIGTKDGTVDNTNVVIDVFGDGITSNGIYNFYEGRIISRGTPTLGNVSDTEEGYFLRTVNYGIYKEAFAESVDTFIKEWDISRDTLAGDNVHAGLKYIAGDGTLLGSTYRLIVYGTGNTKDYLRSGDTSTTPWSIEGFSNKITRIEIDDTVTSFGDFLFYGLSQIVHVIEISENVNVIGTGVFGLVPTTDFTVDTQNTTFESIDGVLYNKANKQLVSYPYGNITNIDYIIEEGTLEVCDYAFYRNTTLERIFFPIVDTITSVGLNAFTDMKNGSIIYLTNRDNISLFSSSNYTSSRTSLYYNYAITNMNAPATVEYDEELRIAPTIIDGNTNADVLYEWYKDGIRIADETSAVYTRNNARFEDSGDYHVVIKNAIYNQSGDYYYTYTSEIVNIKVVDTQVPKSITYGVTYSGDGALVTITAADDQSGVKKILVNEVELYGVTVNPDGTANGTFYVDESGEIVITAVDGFENRTSITINAYDVTYNVNNDIEVNGTVLKQTKITNAPLTLRMNEFTKKGYTFVSWNTSSTGDGINYAEGSEYTANASIELYAIWQVNRYIISFYNNNGLSGDMLVSSDEYDYGEPIILPGIQYRVGETGEDTYRIYNQYGWSGDNTNGDNVDILLAASGDIIRVTTDEDVRYDATYIYEDRSNNDANVRINGNMTVRGMSEGIYNVGGLVIIGSGDTEGNAPTIEGGTYSIRNDNGLVIFEMGIIQGPIYGLIK